MWKKRRGRPPALWNQPEYHARYEMLRAHFARTYHGLPAPYVEGMAQQALTYEVAASPAADNTPLREGIPLPDFIIPGARIAGGWTGGWTGRRQTRLAPQDVLAIRARYAEGGVTQRELAAAYGVRTSTISDVVRAVSWRTLTDPSAGKEDPDVSSNDTAGEDA